jgi:hypothetical protein
MPIVRSGALDPLDQIRATVGFIFVSLKLRWLERGEARKTTVSINKVVFFCHLSMGYKIHLMLLPAGLGGEGRRRLGGSFGASSRWWGACAAVLKISGVNSMVAWIAAMIHGRRGGHSLRLWISATTTSWMEALNKDPRWSSSSSHHQVVCPRWRQGVQRWSNAGGGEDQVLDRVFFSVCRVLFVKRQDCYVISSRLDPVCKLYPPDVYLMQL